MLLTAQLLTSKERIYAMVWIMALSLAYFGVKGGGFTVLYGGRQPGAGTRRHRDR